MKLVIEGSRPIAAVARELGIGEGTLGNWVATYRRVRPGEGPALTANQREPLRLVESDTQEISYGQELLKKTAEALSPG